MILAAPRVEVEAELGQFHPITLCALDDQRDVWTQEHTANLGIEGLRYHPDTRLIDYHEIAANVGWGT